MQKHYTSEGLVLTSEPEVPVVQPVTIDDAIAVPFDPEPEVVHSNQPMNQKISTATTASASSSSQQGRSSNNHTGMVNII
jgi:hypothetical protein